MGFRVYNLMLKDLQTGTLVSKAGGQAQINAVGSSAKVSLVDTVNFATLSNPISLNQGQISFATLDTVLAVDIYGIAPTGHGFVFPGIGQEGFNEIGISKLDRQTTILVPFSFADATPGTEKVTGLTLPANLLISPEAGIFVTTAEATRTLSVGINSGEAGGSATGFINAASVAAAGVVAAKSAATATRGAFLGAGTLDVGKATDGVAKTLSYTLSAGSVAAGGFAFLKATIADTINLLP